MIIRKKTSYSPKPVKAPRLEGEELRLHNVREWMKNFGWDLVDYDDSTRNAIVVCSKGHVMNYKYEGLQSRNKDKNYSCKECKRIDAKVERLESVLSKFGWSLLDYNDEHKSVQVSCKNGHNMDYEYITIIKKFNHVEEDTEVKCKKCYTKTYVVVDKTKGSTVLDKIQIMLNKFGWQLVEYDEQIRKVRILCPNNHEYIYRYDSLQKKYTAKEDDEPEPCKLCLPPPRSKKTPEEMGRVLREAGFDILRNPVDNLESIPYRCAGGCDYIGRVCYKAALNKVNVRSNICVSCAKVSKKEDIEKKFGVPIVAVKSDKTKERAQVTIKCIECDLLFTKSLNNCKPPYNKCGKCLHLEKLNPIEKVEADLGFRGFLWMGDRSEYTGRTIPLTLLCPCGRTCKFDYASVMRGRQCKECWRERRLATRDERYGNEVKLCDGTIIKLEGYTPFAVSFLTNIVGKEHIITDPKKVPYFKWLDDIGVYHCYTPDIMVEYMDKKVIIEVKSMYTWEEAIYKYNLKEKMSAIKDKYEGEVWIISLDETNNYKLLFIQRIVDEELQFVDQSILGIKPPCKIICNK